MYGAGAEVNKEGCFGYNTYEGFKVSFPYFHTNNMNENIKNYLFKTMP